MISKLSNINIQLFLDLKLLKINDIIYFLFLSYISNHVNKILKRVLQVDLKYFNKYLLSKFKVKII